MTIFGAGVPDTDGPTPLLQRGSARIYRKAPLLQSIAVLAEHHEASDGRITTPVDVEKLVSASYDLGCAAPAEWAQDWKEALREEAKFKREQTRAAAKARISEPLSGDLSGWSQNLSPADEQSNAKQVRDTDESIEVVVLRNVAGRPYALPHIHALEGERVDGAIELDRDIARTLATCTVRLPGWALSDSALRELEADGQESWQQSRWLRGALPLVLDEDLSREVGDHVFRYDEQLGLLMERKEKVNP